MRRRIALLLTALISALLASIPSATALPPAGERKDGVFAVEGADPGALSAAIADDVHADDSAGAVVIATSAQFPDLLAGGALVGLLDAPLFLTTGDARSFDYLGFEVTEAIERVADGSTTAFILGGTAAVSTSVEEDIREIPGVARTQRLAGSDRIGTAIAIADYVVDRSESRKVLVARGFGGESPYADALAGGAYAAATGTPILLTETARLSPASRAWLEGRRTGRSFHVLGGTAAISTATENELRGITPSVSRWAGPNRYDTAVAIARASGLWDLPTPCDGTVAQLTVANGNAFQAATLAAVYESPVLLSNGPNTDSARAYLATGDCDPTIAVLSAGDIDADGTATALGSALGRGAPLGSRDNPFPIGQAARTDDPWELRVVEADLDADAELADTFSGAPSEGNQYVLIKVRAKNLGNETRYFNILGLNVEADTGYSDTSGFCGGTDDDLPSNRDVPPGGTIEGDVCFEVPESAVPTLRAFWSYFGEYVPYFALR